MRAARVAAVVFAAFMATVHAASASSEALSRRADYSLLLRSRQFVPGAGIDARLMADGDITGGYTGTERIVLVR